MLDREEMKIRSEWKKLEESFNSMTLNSIAEGEPVPQEAYMQLNDSDVVVNSVKEVPKSRYEDSEEPSGDGWIEPKEPGHYTAGYTVVADVTVSVVMSNGQPVSMSDDDKFNEFEVGFDYHQELSDTVVPYIEDDVDPGYKQDKEADNMGIRVLKMEPTADGKLHFIMTLQVSTDEAPEVDDGGGDEGDWGDDFDPSLLPESKKRKLLDVAGKLLKEASRHLK